MSPEHLVYRESEEQPAPGVRPLRCANCGGEGEIRFSARSFRTLCRPCREEKRL